MKILTGMILAGIFSAIWQKWELKRFTVTGYRIASEKIEKEHHAVVVSDLHGFVYGKENQKLLHKIKSLKPEMILIPGDLIVSKDASTFHTALGFLKEAVKIAPVYYSFGNHETRLRSPEKRDYELFWTYIEKAEKLGVHILNNQSCKLGEFDITGLELPLEYYEKGKIVPMEADYLKEFLKKPAGKDFQILLAHNPAYAEKYALWGADVTFCGHNHGGLIRIPGIGSVFSPQLTWFPKYDAGRFKEAGKDIIVSRGLGTHTFHIRIFNRAELLYIQFSPKEGQNDRIV